jgi:hypothetical protein
VTPAARHPGYVGIARCWPIDQVRVDSSPATYWTCTVPFSAPWVPVPCLRSGCPRPLIAVELVREGSHHLPRGWTPVPAIGSSDLRPIRLGLKFSASHFRLLFAIQMVHQMNPCCKDLLPAARPDRVLGLYEAPIARRQAGPPARSGGFDAYGDALR